MKKKMFSAFGALLFIASGCTSVETFDYSASGAVGEPRFADSGSKKKSVSVLPFLDHRSLRAGNPGLENRPVGECGSFAFGLIPLMPYGFLDKDAPEKQDDFVSTGRFHFDPVNDLAMASAVSLRASGLFSRVERASSFESAKTDYVWRGTLNDSRYFGRILTYGVTCFLSPALWVIGAPSGISTDYLGVKFELVDRASGKVLWTRSWSGSDSIVHWIYARWGRDVSLYPVLMKQAMNASLCDIDSKRDALLR